MKLSIVTLTLLITLTCVCALTSVKGPSILHHLTGRIPSSKLVPAPLRHVLSLLGFRDRKVSKNVAKGSGVLRPLAMSPFAAAASHIRPVYTSQIMLPSNHHPQVSAPAPPSAPSAPSGYDFSSQVLPPYLGDPSAEEPPRLSFVPLPGHSQSPHQLHHHHQQQHHHQQHQHPHHQGEGESMDAYGQMMPQHPNQQVMYIYVDEEGKTISTKVTHPNEGPENSIPRGYNIRPSMKPESDSETIIQPDLPDESSPMTPDTTGPHDGDTGNDGQGEKNLHETLYMLSDYKQFINKPQVHHRQPSHLLQPTSTSVNNGGWIPVSPASYGPATDTSVSTDSLGNNNNTPHTNSGTMAVESPAAASDTDSRSPAYDDAKSNDEYTLEDARGEVNGEADVSTVSSVTESKSTASDSSSFIPKPTVSYIEESTDKLKPQVHFEDSERLPESTVSMISTLTDSSASHSSKLPSISSTLSSSEESAPAAAAAVAATSSSPSPASSTGDGDDNNRSRGFSVAAVFDSDFKPIYTAKNNGEIAFGQRISQQSSSSQLSSSSTSSSSTSSSSTSSSSASRVPRSVRSQKRQYLVPIPGEGGIKAYVVISA